MNNWKIETSGSSYTIKDNNGIAIYQGMSLDTALSQLAEAGKELEITKAYIKKAKEKLEDSELPFYEACKIINNLSKD